MTARILDGKIVAGEILESVSDRVSCLAAQAVHPCLVFIMVEDSPAAEMYEGRLEKLARRTGVRVHRHVVSSTTVASSLEETVAGLNAQDEIDGILVEMPLPDHLASSQVSQLIDARKDVDGITVQNAGRLYLGLPGQAPPTALAMVHMLDTSGIGVLGKHAVVVGRSQVVGHPVTELLLQRDATVTVTHRQTVDLGAQTSQADVLMVGAGEPGLIQPDMLKRGVVIVDAGINVTSGGVIGDVDFVACKEVASAITPVPGGVGPVTNAMLMRNVVTSAEQRDG